MADSDTQTASFLIPTPYTLLTSIPSFHSSSFSLFTVTTLDTFPHPPTPCQKTAPGGGALAPLSSPALNSTCPRSRCLMLVMSDAPRTLASVSPRCLSVPTHPIDIAAPLSRTSGAHPAHNSPLLPPTLHLPYPSFPHVHRPRPLPFYENNKFTSANSQNHVLPRRPEPRPNPNNGALLVLQAFLLPKSSLEVLLRRASGPVRILPSLRRKSPHRNLGTRLLNLRLKESTPRLPRGLLQ